MSREDIVERRVGNKSRTTDTFLDNIGNAVEAGPALKEGLDRHFVGCIHRARNIATSFEGPSGYAKVRETLLVRALEMQGSEARKIKFPVTYRKSCRETECKAYWLAHIRAAELGDDGAVREFHHRVDNGFGMHHDIYHRRNHVEQPAGLDELQALVHHCSGVDGYLCSHIPVRVLESIGSACPGNALSAPGSERASGSGEMNLYQLVALSSEKALEDGRMFAVHRENGRVVLARCSGYDSSCRNQGFLIGKGYYFACFKRCKGRAQAGEAHHSPYYYIYIVSLDQFA